MPLLHANHTISSRSLIQYHLWLSFIGYERSILQKNDPSPISQLSKRQQNHSKKLSQFLSHSKKSGDSLKLFSKSFNCLSAASSSESMYPFFIISSYFLS